MSWKDRCSNLPVLAGDEARMIDLVVTDIVGRVRGPEIVATRLSDAIMYQLDVDENTPMLFVAGKGNNGANAIGAARMLHKRGRETTVLPLVDVRNGDELRPNIKEHIDLYRHFAGEERILSPSDISTIEGFEGVIVDGILGTGISSPPRGVSGDAIRAINAAAAAGKSRVLSIDVPSGLNHVTGEAPGDCVRATWTMNLHMLKSGQLEPNAGQYIGELWSAESGLGFRTFPGMVQKFNSFYKRGPIVKVQF